MTQYMQDIRKQLEEQIHIQLWQGLLRELSVYDPDFIVSPILILDIFYLAILEQ